MVFFIFDLVGKIKVKLISVMKKGMLNLGSVPVAFAQDVTLAHEGCFIGQTCLMSLSMTLYNYSN